MTHDPDLSPVDFWKWAHGLGIAGGLCDFIVRMQPVPMALADALVAAIERDEEPMQPKLTVREVQAVQLAADGYTGRSAAEFLGITHHTLSEHWRSILSKLEARNQTNAVYLAWTAGLIV